MNIEITKSCGSERDISDIAKIELECFSHPWLADDFREVTQNPTSVFFIARDGDISAGFIGAYLLCGEAQILNVAVSEKYRRNGVGRALINHLISYCRENHADCATLEVRISNNAAIALYESFGFERVGVRPRYYDCPVEDAVLMTLSIN